jgi:pilus assembly protein CpaE
MYPFTIALLISTPDLWDEVQAALKNLPVRVAFEMAAVDSLAVLVDKVERYRPEILLLDAATVEGRLAELVAAVRSASASPKVMVLDKSPDSERILAALRAGVSEYLYPPLDGTLKEAFERLSKDRDPRARPAAETHKGRSFGFLSAKGGCGATTLACHAAVEMQVQTGKETVLADLDLSSGLVRFLMQAKTRYSVVDAMRNVERLDRSYWDGLVSNGRPGLDVLSAPLDESTRDLPHLHEIRHVLRFARNHYSWLIADLGHGLDALTWNAVEEMDELVLVSTMEVAALHRAKAIARQLRDAGFDKERLRLVVNRIPRKSEVTVEELERVLDLKVFDTIPNDYRALEQAYAEGRLLTSDQPVRQRIGRIAAKLAGVTQDTRRRGKFAIFR